MEIVWSTYGIPMEQHAITSLSPRLQHACNTLAASDARLCRPWANTNPGRASDLASSNSSKLKLDRGAVERVTRRLADDQVGGTHLTSIFGTTIWDHYSVDAGRGFVTRSRWNRRIPLSVPIVFFI